MVLQARSVLIIAQVVTDNPLQILAFVFLLQHLRLNFLLCLFIYGLLMYMKGHPLPPHHISVISKGAVAFIFITVLYKVFAPLENVWYWMLVVLSVLTMLIGNLFACASKT
jgi:NADH-quinone oxidoreductase subunit N